MELRDIFAELPRSCSVNGPLGFSSAWRIAALSPGSGIVTSCAPAESAKQVNIPAPHRAEMVFEFIAFI